MSVAALVGACVGLVAGLVAVPLVRRLPAGIPERLAQPAWTARAGHPALLAAVGALAGLAVGLGAADRAALALGLVLIAVLVPACAIDIAWRVVPDSLLVAGAVASVLVVAALAPGQLVGRLLVALIGGVGALLLWALARGGLGFGDVKLVALLGLALGASLVSALVAALALAGAAAIAVLVRRGRGATLPLVPFLGAGALVAIALDIPVSAVASVL